MARDYRREYDTYHSKPAQKKNRAARNSDRAKAVAKGRVRKGDGKDVGHTTPLKTTGAKNRSSTMVQSKKSNRSEGGRIGNKAGKARGGRKK